jgi:hypothetical protein
MGGKQKKARKWYDEEYVFMHKSNRLFRPLDKTKESHARSQSLTRDTEAQRRTWPFPVFR